MFLKNMWQTFCLCLWMTLLTGLIYPLAITAIAQLAYPKKAKGSFVLHRGEVKGSALIGQQFESNSYFWGRPSAVDYNPLPSGATHLGPTSATLKQQVASRKEKLAHLYSVDASKIPTELLFASGSGLDPHISIAAAYFQAARVAKARKMEETALRNLIDRLATGKSWGKPYVNVLQLNLSLDNL